MLNPRAGRPVLPGAPLRQLRIAEVMGRQDLHPVPAQHILEIDMASRGFAARP